MVNVEIALNPNADCGIILKLLDSVRLVMSFSVKTKLPRVTTLSGIITSPVILLAAKANSSISLTVFGMVTEVMFCIFCLVKSSKPKAVLPITVTLYVVPLSVTDGGMIKFVEPLSPPVILTSFGFVEMTSYSKPSTVNVVCEKLSVAKTTISSVSSFVFIWVCFKNIV